VIRNIHVHYRASGIDFPPERLAEIDSRWVEAMIDVDQARGARPLHEPRHEKIVGCCRDAALLTVSALRAKGVPARTRVGFADYLEPGYHCDHVVTEYFDGRRWIACDTELGIDEVELGPGGLQTAAQAWTAYRRGEIDAETYGVGPGIAIGGPAMIRRYVLFELAHRFGDELLLWDFWGDTTPPLVDEVAAMLLAADAGEAGAEEALERRYATDPRLHPGDLVLTVSPAERYPADTRLSTHRRTGEPARGAVHRRTDEPARGAVHRRTGEPARGAVPVPAPLSARGG
jgi:hypothetical protein